MNAKTRLKLDIAVVRTLLDEVERTLEPNAGVTMQLVEELARLLSSLATEVTDRRPKRLRDVA
jgi:hypothetical protein